MNRLTGRSIRELRDAAPFIAPGLILVSLFIIYPMIRNLMLSLSEYHLVKQEMRFIGFENYRNLFKGYQGRFWYAYRNNLLYALITTPVTLFCGLTFAVLINSLGKKGNFFRTTFYLPVVTSWIIVGLVFRYLFSPGESGLVNHVLVNILGILKEPVNWLNREWSGNAVIWMLGIWKGIGYPMMIYLAALQSIPKDLYESASIAGAGPAACFFRITIPLVKPVTFFLAVQSVIGSFNVLLQVLLLTGGGPSGRTSVLQYMMYTRIFQLSLFGEGAAIGILTAVSIYFITILMNRTLKVQRYKI
ncbi:MAG: carbohydrate ABC transporter permease [Spirochaetia bacterium]